MKKKATTPMTEKQKKLVKAVVKNGGNKTKAGMAVYKTKKPANAQRMAAKALKQPNVQQALEAELKKQGITLESSIAPISKGLKAKVRNMKGALVCDEDGNPIDDIDTQLKASDRALKLLLPKERPEANLSFNFNIDSAKFGGEFVKEGEIVDE
jgi:hypothetical protein